MADLLYAPQLGVSARLARQDTLPRPPARSDEERAVVRAELDAAFYRAANPDLGAFDPVEHFVLHGWREGRAPNTWFDTAWYLATYEDIAAAGINPLLHYVLWGKAEGRLPARPGGWRRGVVEAAMPAAARPTGPHLPEGAAPVDPAALLDGPGARLVLSVSHDCYLHVTGGIQTLIAGELAASRAAGEIHVHVSPTVPRLTLAPDDGGPAWLQLAVDGRYAGLVRDTELATALAARRARWAERRLALHSLFGHSVPGLLRLAAALEPGASLFWLHDYASLCEGYNLLRDDAVFCHAPPPASAACGICVHGPTRGAYLAALGRLFGAIGFHVIAPSRAALDLWLGATTLPFLTARVRENAAFQPGAPRPRAPRGEADDPVRVAFAGYPMVSKGWPIFQDLVRACRHLRAYRFFHFAAHPTAMDGVTWVEARATAAHPAAMAEALAAQEIDLVLALSIWPETFSFVAHEALAAGAWLVALAESGNIADAIRRHEAGAILSNEAALLRFFADGRAIDLARAHAMRGIRPGRLV